ncbi:MAG: hypothetical protein MPJ06_03090 [Nitrosopumilus sp.]|nr:hypothetical protein [Nitrosopumilus sp.]MDA7942979.1 hypothetical protein [Nitrosopumilus sp.]MDA7998356.1 hypothetical protein [Nitrosopumilus sp.]
MRGRGPRRVGRIIIHDGCADGRISGAVASCLSGLGRVETRGGAAVDAGGAMMGTHGGAAMYEGHALRSALSRAIGADQGIGTVHMLLTDMLVCTREGDRIHARTMMAPSPAIVSVRGIIEGPARPPGYYADLAEFGRAGPARGRYLEEGDPRIAGAACVCAYQAAAYCETGEGPCGDPGCVLYDAHLQGELLGQAAGMRLCGRHPGLPGPRTFT